MSGQRIAQKQERLALRVGAKDLTLKVLDWSDISAETAAAEQKRKKFGLDSTCQAL